LFPIEIKSLIKIKQATKPLGDKSVLEDKTLTKLAILLGSLEFTKFKLKIPI
jgi:hypothetical protein